MKMRVPAVWSFWEDATTEIHCRLVANVQAPLAHVERALMGPTCDIQPIRQEPMSPGGYSTEFVLGDGVASEKCHGLWHFSPRGSKFRNMIAADLEGVA